MDNTKNTFLHDEYITRINKVQDYIENNLSEAFSLQQLSQVANFSPFHFHRIFYMMTGETLFQYIQRIRLEKAAFLLLANRKAPITKIALDCGFSNQASFAKAFKKYFNMSASGIRAEDGKSESNMGKVYSETMHYNSIMREKQLFASQIETDMLPAVEIKNISDMPVVYIRHTGPYKKDAVLFEKLYSKLYGWADERALIHNGTRWITLFHDSTELTAEDKLRISICMTAPGNVKVDGAIGRLTIAGGKYAVGHFELGEDQFQEAWGFLYCKWLPESGYQPDDRLCFELYSGESTENSAKKHRVDICIPIRAL